MKLLIVADLHGRKPRIPTRDFDAIICPGDICDDRGWRPFWDRVFRTAKKEPGVSFDELYTRLVKLYGGARWARKEYAKSLKKGNKVLRFLDSFGKPVFFTPGNWDQMTGESKVQIKRLGSGLARFFYGKTNPKLLRGLKNIRDCQFTIHTIPGLNVLGYGDENRTASEMIKGRPVKKRKILMQEHKKAVLRLGREYAKRDRGYPTLFLPHNVPYKTKVDIVMKKDSPLYGEHNGSSIARAFCLKYQPLLCVGSHIHEHHRKDKLKNTTVINAGFGPRACTLVEIKNNKIKSVKFFD